MRAQLLLLVLLLAACGRGPFFDPKIKDGMYTCGPAMPECPQGQGCIEGRCRYPADLSAGMSMPDQGALDMSVPSGCARGGGYPVGVDADSRVAFACPGGWEPGEMGRMCAAGYSPCDATTAYHVDQAKCNASPGFFVAPPIRASSPFMFCPGQYLCNDSEFTKFRPGCGAEFPEARFFADCDTTCSGFKKGMTCQYSQRWGYICDRNDPVKDKNGYPNIGLLCCKSGV